MSKIICDVCGTSYPETESRCPICGCVRSGDAKSVPGNEPEAEGAEGQQYAKGGHFSKSNVRKRNKANQQAMKEEVPADSGEQYEDSKAGKGLAIVAVILLLAIIAVVIFIAMRFFLPGITDPNGDNPSIQTTTQPNVPDDGTTGPVTIPCEELELTVTEVQLTQANQQHTIAVTVKPANCTETQVYFRSNNSNVATVSNQGVVTAVGEGEATITITCGDQTAEFKVICSFIPDVTEPPVTEPPVTEPPVKLELNRSDFSLFYKGHSWNVYDGDIPVSEIKWYSDNDAIATITNGKVVAVAPGSVQVHAEYAGQKVSCWVRCSFKADDITDLPGTGGGTEEGAKEYVFNNNYGNKGASDVTIWVTADADGNIVSKDMIRIYLEEKETGVRVAVTWTSSDTNVCTVDDNKITAAGPGTAKVTGEYDGKTYTYTVRVAKKTQAPATPDTTTP